MISIIVWTVTYLIIAGGVFYHQCDLDRKQEFIHHRTGPVRCIFWAVIWPLGLLLGALIIIYERIVYGK